MKRMTIAALLLAAIMLIAFSPPIEAKTCFGLGGISFVPDNVSVTVINSVQVEVEFTMIQEMGTHVLISIPVAMTADTYTRTNHYAIETGTLFAEPDIKCRSAYLNRLGYCNNTLGLILSNCNPVTDLTLYKAFY